MTLDEVMATIVAAGLGTPRLMDSVAADADDVVVYLDAGTAAQTLRRWVELRQWRAMVRAEDITPGRARLNLHGVLPSGHKAVVTAPFDGAAQVAAIDGLLPRRPVELLDRLVALETAR